MNRKTELQKTALKVMLAELNGVSTLQEKQYLAKKQNNKVLLIKSHEYSPPWRITSLFVRLLISSSF